jgi:hypothetical protein
MPFSSKTPDSPQTAGTTRVPKDYGIARGITHPARLANPAISFHPAGKPDRRHRVQGTRRRLLQVFIIEIPDLREL